MTGKDKPVHLADLAWFKSSYSDTSEPSDCVEVATTPATVHVRDSKRPDGPRLAVDSVTWTAFVAGALAE
ncbi:DUF397 domain-containing protein [Streptomyces violaceorubidus]|uniref:DUF397 domain-containing protein n=1 Tax=Streptomyces violaceorubidus TaxID=284042 RepID=UPI0004C0B959|nr:DUF397 domain-containing protein [Streptomyces violaceorubidus]